MVWLDGLISRTPGSEYKWVGNWTYPAPDDKKLNPFVYDMLSWGYEYTKLCDIPLAQPVGWLRLNGGAPAAPVVLTSHVISPISHGYQMLRGEEVIPYSSEKISPVFCGYEHVKLPKVTQNCDAVPRELVTDETKNEALVEDNPSEQPQPKLMGWGGKFVVRGKKDEEVPETFGVAFHPLTGDQVENRGGSDSLGAGPFKVTGAGVNVYGTFILEGRFEPMTGDSLTDLQSESLKNIPGLDASNLSVGTVVGRLCVQRTYYKKKRKQPKPRNKPVTASAVPGSGDDPSASPPGSVTTERRSSRVRVQPPRHRSADLGADGFLSKRVRDQLLQLQLQHEMGVEEADIALKEVLERGGRGRGRGKGRGG